MQYKVGDTIAFLNEPGGGIILKVLSQNQYEIEDENGFSCVRYARDLVPVYSQEYTVENLPKESSPAKKTTQKTGRRKPEQILEIDLHLHELVESPQQIEFSRMLDVQMTHCKSFIQKAQKKGIKKVRIIHGVGQGTLKSAIRKYAREIGVKEYYDADFRTYGQGATEILL